VSERRPGLDHERDPEQRLTLAEAAEVLGLSKDGVRMRVRRGTLRSEKGEDGRVYVFVTDQDGTAHETDPQGQVEASRELVDTLRSQVEDLRARLDREQDAHAEARRIIAGLVQRIPELEPPAETPTAPPGSPERAAEETERVPPRPATPDQQAGSERSWWRRIFGG
jgi:hypothetical protein